MKPKPVDASKPAVAPRHSPESDASIKTSGSENATAGELPGGPGCMPAPFELAVLAEILTLRPEATSSPEAAVLEAMGFWKAAKNLSLAGPQLRKLFEGVFTLTQQEWDTLVQQYLGDTGSLHDWLDGRRNDSPKFHMEKDVLPRLFEAKNETYASRVKKLGELLQFARAIGWSTRILLPGNSRTRITKVPLDKESAAWRQPIIPVETLLGRNLNVLQTRWLVTARQEFISQGRSHPKKQKEVGDSQAGHKQKHQRQGNEPPR